MNALVLDMFLSLQGAYQSTTSGKFQDAISKLRNILLNVTLLIVDSKSEISEVRVCPALLVACLLSALNEWLVDCGMAKVLHRRSEGDGDSCISVFGYCCLFTLHQYCNWTSQDLQFTLYCCYASSLQCHVTCNYLVKLGTAAVDHLQRIYLGSLYGIGTQGDA